MATDKKWILLNVGGTYFMTSRSTLTKSTPPNSPLHRISTNSTNVNWDKDERGAYLIDRDPDLFKEVLNFLRNRRLVLRRDTPEEALLLEAEYFNLPTLSRIIKQRIHQHQQQEQQQQQHQLQQQLQLQLQLQLQQQLHQHQAVQQQVHQVQPQSQLQPPIGSPPSIVGAPGLSLGAGGGATSCSGSSVASKFTSFLL